MNEGERLKQARERRGLTQKELAMQIGVAWWAVARWERGERPVSKKFLKPLCEVLYIKQSWLKGEKAGMAGTDKRPKLISRTYCEGCFHFCISGMQMHCNYICNTGHMRPCPAGEGCTERISPEEWRKKNEGVRVEFNGYYPELRKDKKHAE